MVRKHHYRFNALLILACLATSLLGLSPAQAVTTSALTNKVISLTQVVVGSTSTVTGKTGALAYVNGDLGTNIDGYNIPAANAIASMQPQNYGTTMAQSDVLASAASWIGYSVGPLVTSIRTYMTANGIGYAWFNYDQKITVAGGKIKHLVWSVYMDDQSRPIYGDPKLVDETPGYLYVVYTPYAVTSGLPQSWQYPDAGNLRWMMVDSQFNPLTNWTVIPTNGAYDAPQVASGTAFDPDYGLKCLMNKTSDPGCTQGYSDVKALLDQTGATLAIVDYVRTLQPVYDEVTDPSTGVTSQIAQVAVSVDTRTWKTGQRFFFIAPGGVTQYTNSGRIGYQLNEIVDRYVQPPGDTYMPVNEFTTSSMSPTQNYSKTINAPGGNCTNYYNLIIDPFNTLNLYDWRNDTVNGLPPDRYTYVAPLAC